MPRLYLGILFLTTVSSGILELSGWKKWRKEQRKGGAGCQTATCFMALGVTEQ